MDKLCTKCKSVTTSKNSWCYSCLKEYRRQPEVKERSKKYIREYKRKYREDAEVIEYEKKHRKGWNFNSRLKKYNISLEQYNTLVDECDNKCSICKIAQEDAGKHGLSIDHNHKTGIVRGLLCSSCNTSLGGFKDNVELLTQAILYLKKNT